MAELAQWDSFYVIVGSAAGALIGLQFVVMTLIAERPPLRAAEAGAAFGTPTIIHFSATLLLAAALRAPWQTITPAAILLAVVGLWGIGYSVVVIQHMRRQSAYQPDLADWIYFAVLPLIAYVVLASSALATISHAREALFGAAAAALILLFTAIHNAWDSVAYHVFVSRGGSDRNLP
jgi:hypothetical protein